MGRGNELAVVVREFERGRLGANLEDAERLGCESLSFEAGYGAGMDSLHVSGNVLGNELFPLSKDFA
jgi:hypothetical protein